MKMNVLLLAVVAVMPSVLSTRANFNVSLELQGDCSDKLTLICRHSDDGMAPLWIHNGTTESGEVLDAAFPGAVYNVLTRTEHTTTITGVDSAQALDGFVIQCAYEDLGTLTKSNAVKYSFIPHDFQPKLKRTDVVQSFRERFCTLTYELEDYTEGIAKYPRCADQFSVNFTVAPNADMSSISTDAVAQCNITNLERCEVYDILARFYRGDQVLDTVYDVDSVMTTPGVFNVSNVTFVSSTVVHITIEEVSPDCPSFPTLWYNITIRRGDGDSNQTKQVEANNFPPLNDSLTITVTFDTPLPQGMLDVEVLKVNAVPVKLNETGSPVEMQAFQNWNSSSRATAFNQAQTMANNLAAFNVSLELQGGNCSDQITLICRHIYSGNLSDPNWIHNGTVESGQLLGTAFPGAMYTVQSNTEHRVTISGVGNVQALDGYIIQCVYGVLGNLIESNAVKYSFIPPDYRPVLSLVSNKSDFFERLSTFTYSFNESCRLYPRCTPYFSVEHTVSPQSAVSNFSSGCSVEYTIHNLMRCVSYQSTATALLGSQRGNPVVVGDTVMLSPGQFNITDASIGADRNLINVTYMENEPDCPGYPTERYTVGVDGVQVADLTADTVQSLAINHTNGSVTLPLPLSQPLPENEVTLRMTQYNTVPTNRSDVTGNIVTEMATWGTSAVFDLFRVAMEFPLHI